MQVIHITGAMLAFATLYAVADDTAVFLSHQAASDHSLSADPSKPEWSSVPATIVSSDRYGKPIPGAETAIRSVWTEQALYFLFVSNYESLYLKPEPSTATETWGLWEWDVVEVFIGYDANHIRQYKEFEVSPQGEWVDLDVDRDRKGKEVDWLWNSGFEAKTRIDRDGRKWMCEIRIPWKSIDPRKATTDNGLRLNLYRIEGAPPNRKFIAWRPVNTDSFHTPEAFGRLRLVSR